MILVTGATGTIGRSLVGELTGRGVPFRALVRSAAKGAELGCDHVVGDFDDPDSITAALTGVDRLFLNSTGVTAGPGEQPIARRQRTVIDAAVRAGVSAVVKVSVWKPRHGGKLALGAHWEAERHLRASGLDWAVLQPTGFMQNFVTGAALVTEDGDILGAYGDAGVAYVDCRDIAAVAAELLTGTRWNEDFALTGPEAIDHRHIAARLSAVTGRTIRYVDLPPDELAARLTGQGLPADFAADIAELFAEVGAGAQDTTTTTVRDVTGRDPRTFERFLADHADLLAVRGTEAASRSTGQSLVQDS
ncbi:SDR family oxidoreductase [Actinosynnema sp. NPDC047251]|uniref:NmrA-like domain-containing protein n=1 Tax=Saccharothrix espanaensis (strain ATCC 51144 / DSM 44229 / JCM 9112 / NBRC 15066 / NRRL 15764) TaxID=1179773 RepID=K0JV20_SACES|nr:SDR family oxidoreductase [Saccharothrix espanaensis]CCH31705.1 hypothetical protein BN6_44240 [Saccharothrix espanaensis DSM 44229]